MGNNKAIWEDLGERDAYYAVLTYEQFRAGNLDENAREVFFELGRAHMEEVTAEFERVTGEELNGSEAIDYGCGVGRVLLPLADRFEAATGVDISSSMLDKCRRNAAAVGKENIRFQTAQEFIAAENDAYDMVHTFIVLQHVRPSIGYEIVNTLLKRLRTGGRAMIHVTYRNTDPWFRRMRSKVYRDLPGVHRLSTMMSGRDAPFLPMYEYDISRVTEVFHLNSCEIVSEKETDHGFIGKMFFLLK